MIDHEVLCKIMFEHTQEDIDARDDGFFDDKVFTGSFELTIGKNKNITIENLDSMVTFKNFSLERVRVGFLHVGHE